MGLEIDSQITPDSYDTRLPRLAINLISHSPLAGALERSLKGRASGITSSRELSEVIQPGETVLDVGVGTGHITNLVQKITGGRVIGIDLADLRTPSTRERGEFLLSDGRYLPIRDSAVNVVMLMDVLHLSSNPEQLLREAFRVLKPGGRVVILEDTIPEEAHPVKLFAVKLMNMLLNTQRVWSDSQSYHSRERWRQILTEIGFDPDVHARTWHWNFKDLTPLGRVWPFGPFESTRLVATKRNS